MARLIISKYTLLQKSEASNENRNRGDKWMAADDDQAENRACRDGETPEERIERLSRLSSPAKAGKKKTVE